MAKDPGFIFYPGDYLRGTQCLSENVQVAYDRIMCEHMRNICISRAQLNFFTKKLTPDEVSELKTVLTENSNGFQIDWVVESINKRRAYSQSRRENYQQNNNAGSTSSPIYSSSNKDCFFAKFCLSSIPLGIKENSLDKTAENVSVFPNPNNGDFSVILPEIAHENIQYELIDLTGKLIEAGTRHADEKTLIFNYSNKAYKSGMYFLKLTESKGVFVTKIIIE